MHYLISYIRNFFRFIRRFFIIDKEGDLKKLIPEITDQEINLIHEFDQHSMTPLLRRWAMIQSLHYINKNRIEGDIVECGIWRGGSLFLAKRFQDKYYKNVERNFYGFDTFEGMSKPSIYDYSTKGVPAIDIYNKMKDNKEKNESSNFARASLEDVISSAKLFFEDISCMKFIKGKVEDTLLKDSNLPNKISLLRLDTDWYESTLIELKKLYPLLSLGGILIVDDYGDWLGAKKAVDEYFNNKNVFKSRIDNACRLYMKIEN